MRKLLIILISYTVSFAAFCATLNDAKSLYLDGKFKEALPIFMDNYKKNPKNASLNQWIGVCMYNQGKYKESIKYLKFAHSKKVIEAPYYLALSNYELGNYDEAMDYFSDYEDALSSNKRKMPDNHKNKIENIKLANVMLDHVEKIEVIDSLIVDKQLFFNYFKISPEIGRLQDITVLDNLSTNDPISPVYVPESGDKMFWADLSDNGHYKLFQSTKLFDNSWDTPSMLDTNLPDSIDIITPFMLPDGTTFYYATNGPGSLGGYDIFVASKDLETGEFYTPQNLGMPYNSQYDDYMYVVDEFTGAGWWATDRNQIPDKLTIYIFKPSNSRVNYNIDDPNLQNLAKLSSIRDTWTPGADYSSLLAKIDAIDMDAEQESADFIFVVTNDKIYRKYSDFKSKSASDMMHRYVKQLKSLNSKIDELNILRQSYKNEANGKSYSNKILQDEADVAKLRESLKTLANSIREAELNNN